MECGGFLREVACGLRFLEDAVKGCLEGHGSGGPGVKVGEGVVKGFDVIEKQGGIS